MAIQTTKYQYKLNAKFLRARIKAEGWGAQTKISMATGNSPNWLAVMLRSDSLPLAGSLFSLADTLGVTADQLTLRTIKKKT